MEKFRDIRSYFGEGNNKDSISTNISNSRSNLIIIDSPDKAEDHSSATTVSFDKLEDRLNTIKIAPTACIPSRNDATYSLQCTLDLGDIDSGPKQPHLYKYPLAKFGKQNRSFSYNLFSVFKWLEYSVQVDKAFCFVCRHFDASFSTDEVFTRKGFNNWKKAREKFEIHGRSKAHLTCAMKYTDYKTSKNVGSVHTQLSQQLREEIHSNQEYVKKIIDLILYLTRQGNSLRGHDEKGNSGNRGNFLELCELLAKYDHSFATMQKTYFNLTSGIVQNEIIDIISNMTINKICDEIRECGMLALLADEARCFKEEQLSICVRYVKHFEPQERFLLFLDCSGAQDSESLANLIFASLKKLELENIPIVGQSYDGASVMSGIYSGVQTRVKAKYPEATYVHCNAHKINLIVTDTCRNIQSTQFFFNVVESLYHHFAKPSSHKILKKIQIKLAIKRFEIGTLSATRWSCRYKNCATIIQHYDAIVEALQTEVNDGKDKDAIEAMGILSSMNTANFIVNLFVLHEMLETTETLNKFFQSTEANIGEAIVLINSTIRCLENVRREKEFDCLWKKIETFTSDRDISLQHPNAKKRKVKPNVFMKDSVVPSTIGNREYSDVEGLSEKDFWKITVFYRVFDNVLSNLKMRFSDEIQNMGKSIDSFLKLDFENSTLFINMYKKRFKIDENLVKAEMLVLKNSIQNDNPLVEDLKQIIKKNMFPNTFSLFQVALCLPISSATGERSFSAMRRIKTWLRKSMGQTRFSNIAIIHIENNFVKENLTVNEIFESFASKKNRKFPLRISV